MNDLKYINYDIVFQEVPNEISLVFNISGCPHKCEGCHSKYLWEYTGNLIDYLKIGPYVKSLGGLDSCETNQKMYKIYGNDMTDITYLFRKKG